MLNRCYTGRHRYNATTRVPNPKRPLGDITGAVRRTLITSKPPGEAVEFSVPALITEELWLKANRATRERGRGRGKEGRVITSLLRNRIFCPRCGKPMVLKRRGHTDKFYYLCSRLYHASEIKHCAYRRFVPGTWDDMVWDCVHALLKDKGWIQERLSALEKQNVDIEKLVKLEEQKVQQIKNKIARVREGYEGGLYNLDETKTKISGYLEVIKKAEQEIKRIMYLMGDHKEPVNIEQIKTELKKIGQENLDTVTFAEKRDIINKLGIRVYPTEDLKSVKIRCSLNQANDNNSHAPQKCGIIEFASLRSQ